jgi:hypothetical protein
MSRTRWMLVVLSVLAAISTALGGTSVADGKTTSDCAARVTHVATSKAVPETQTQGFAVTATVAPSSCSRSVTLKVYLRDGQGRLIRLLHNPVVVRFAHLSQTTKTVWASWDWTNYCGNQRAGRPHYTGYANGKRSTFVEEAGHFPPCNAPGSPASAGIMDACPSASLVGVPRRSAPYCPLP